jgi:BirA family transcriptional regulator, biotin operon repressor / biotin---[acetyl-CoA-carboxylase] ligase
VSLLSPLLTLSPPDHVPRGPREEWHLPTRRLGRRVLVFDRLDSTNTYAASLAADPANNGLVVLTREQTAGRGQHGRTWTSPTGAGVLLSVLLFPPPALRRPALLTAWAAVSVCETILRVAGLQARIKWPNDVLVRGRKVCGILIEQARGTVVGIGLNVNQAAEWFAAAGLPDAASLATLTAKSFECDHVARTLVAQLDEEYERLCRGDLATLEAGWKRRVGLLGKSVRAECHNGVHRGRLLAMGWDGLEIRGEDGRICRLEPESVRHLLPV